MSSSIGGEVAARRIFVEVDERPPPHMPHSPPRTAARVGSPAHDTQKECGQGLKQEEGEREVTTMVAIAHSRYLARARQWVCNRWSGRCVVQRGPLSPTSVTTDQVACKCYYYDE